MVHRDLHQITRGGICTVYRSLATQMAARGHRVTMITQQTPHPVSADPGVGIETLPRTEDLRAHRASVAKLLRQLEPDIVECSTWEAEALTYLAEPVERRSPVLVRGEFSATTLGAQELAADEHQLVHMADRTVAVSHWAATDLAEAYGIRTPAVVYNGIDRARFRPGPHCQPASGLRVTLDAAGELNNPVPIAELLQAGELVPPFTTDPHGRTRLIWVGKITPMKGWDLLEHLAVRLKDVAVITALLGHSHPLCPITNASEQITVLHDLSDSDLPHLYRSADWILSTSRWEGFGLALAEAIACGTPALMPEQLGTAPELLAAGGGLTYRDADHLADILRGPTAPAGDLPDHFDWTINAEVTLAHYRQLIDAS
ncbi:glycosyltransferase family 4 protein [Nocardia nepalensis]|uniref:glycosyltransferase family 4 protein n=1 Tax=Nocardia nepalensis TaxID=3375448 RepID=UPI003B67F04D